MKDLTNIKEISIYDLALSYNLELTPHSYNWYCSPCPSCGGEDRFMIDVRKNVWFCRQAVNHRNNGDVIEFVRMMENCDFKKAVQILENGTYGTTVQHCTNGATQTQEQAYVNTFDADKFRGILEKSWVYLSRDSKQRKYILSRGIDLDTAQKFKLGGGYGGGAEAIAIPYYDLDGQLIGGRWRMINPTDQRYYAWKGSNLRYGFGWHTHKGSDTLLICEGEFNAISINQVEPDIDVLSLGSENSTISPKMAEHIMGEWKRIIIWADSKSGVDRWTNSLPTYERQVISPHMNDKKQDANQLLVNNELETFLGDILKGTIGNSRAYINQMKHYFGR